MGPDTPHTTRLPHRPRWLARLPRPATGPDVCTGAALLLAEGVVFLFRSFVADFTLTPLTAAQSAQATQVLRHWTLGICLAALGCALVAALVRARWSAGIQLFAAVLLGLLYLPGPRQATPGSPTPAPTAYYSPCYSGSHCG
jgi:Family of unknown function (DUF6234)